MSKNKKPRPWLVQFLHLALWGTLIYFCWNNILPYEAAAKQWMTGGRGLSQSTWILSKIPLIGGLVGRAGFWIVGAFCWAVLQSLQILPLVVFQSPKVLKNLINRDSQHGRFQVGESDGFVLRAIKGAYNKLPLTVVENLMYGQIAAYAAEFIVNTWYFPITNGNTFWVLATFQFHKIKWESLISIILTLFAVEGLVWLLIQVQKILEAFKQEASGGGQTEYYN